MDFPLGFISIIGILLSMILIYWVQQVFRTKSLDSSVNHTFISLIPKVPVPTTPGDFRPISLSNALYKILANRIKPYLDRLVSQNQSVFIPNRQITDNIVVAHEVLHTMKTCKRKIGHMAIKLDLSKAFDRMEWSFIIHVFRLLGFSDDFCDLIYMCISTVTYSVLVNGSPGDSFTPSRGIRQGDPLSPTIFILCMEALSKLLLHAEQQKLVTGVKVLTGSTSVSHLFFADDAFLFTNATIVQARNLLDILNMFSLTSGQTVNYQKSGVYF